MQILTADYYSLYTLGDGNIEPTGRCDHSYYCPSGQVSPAPGAYECWPGHYCRQETDVPDPCEDGTYQPSPPDRQCEPCTVGYYCDNNVAGNNTENNYPAKIMNISLLLLLTTINNNIILTIYAYNIR